MIKFLHLVSFDVPYPPNYGGVIDILFKIKALSAQGVKIHLHTFEYGRGEHNILEDYCESVTYYRRNMSPMLLFSKIPFIVLSRKNKILLKNLQKDKYPVLFEGLHTSYYLKKITKKTYIRAHNIEHNFYKGLANSEQQLLKKLFFKAEAIKLKSYENILKKVNGIFSISKTEQDYFSDVYGEKAIYIPAFHDANFKKHTTNKGKFIMWHGDLRVSDNVKAALFIINVFKDSSFLLKIASSEEHPEVIKQINNHQNISFTNIKNETTLDYLFEKAHVNVLVTYQKTGIKLKLLNSLYKGKFVLGNDKMIGDTGLETLCEIANNKEEVLVKTSNLFQQKFTEKVATNRKKILNDFSPEASAKKIVTTIFEH